MWNPLLLWYIICSGNCVDVTEAFYSYVVSPSVCMILSKIFTINVKVKWKLDLVFVTDIVVPVVRIDRTVYVYLFVYRDVAIIIFWWRIARNSRNFTIPTQSLFSCAVAIKEKYVLLYLAIIYFNINFRTKLALQLFVFAYSTAIFQ